MEVVQSAEIPPSTAPLLQVDAVSRSVDLEEVLSGGEPRQSYALEWDDGPVAFRVRGIASPLIALAVSYHAGPDSICENTAQVLIFRRDAAKQVVHAIGKTEQVGRSTQVAHPQQRDTTRLAMRLGSARARFKHHVPVEG